jgi:small subunit ribosomal protein S1
MSNEEKKMMEKWLSETFDYERPKRGELREGTILQIDDAHMLIDVGLKTDGLVPRSDLAQLDEETLSELQPGQVVETRVITPTDREGELILSLYQAQQEENWQQAQALLDRGKIWEGEVIGANRGGLLVKFEHLQGFVPKSHLWQRKQNQNDFSSVRQAYLGRTVPLNVIEVDRNQNRLVFSERLARKQLRAQKRKQLLNKLEEGQVVSGVVTKLVKFGAFVDLGGADGLIHISELAWQHIQHPGEILQVGDEVEVYVLRLDHNRQHIKLSRKRLQPSPWDTVDERYAVGQQVSGTVTGLVNFGAFVRLEDGLEGLVHISELSDPPPTAPQDIVRPGDELTLRILKIDGARQRMGLSLKAVSLQESDEEVDEQPHQETGEAEQESTETDPTDPLLQNDGFWFSLLEDEEKETLPGETR